MGKWKSISAAAVFCLLLSGCGLREPAAATAGLPAPAESSKETQGTAAAGAEAESSTSAAEESLDQPPLLPGTPEEVPGCDIIIASDIHYLSTQLTDFGPGFTYTVEHGDGKIVNYVWQITEAFLAEVVEQKPDALILSGDLSLNGELDSHKELAAVLSRVTEAGIPVLVIPGNHDINNSSAAQFREAVRYPAEHVTAEQFAEIYKNFGYGQAISRDVDSLSYVYQLDDYHRILMLDTCQYDPVNRIGGMIKPETYDWISGQLEEAWDHGMNVIPVAHHNLLDESEIYVDDCTIEHSGELIGLLEDWSVPLFLSGHLHVQHFMSKESGIYEVVTSSLSTPPCQYGLLHFGDDGSFRYRTRAVDIEGWARRNGSTEKNLLNFERYGREFLEQVFYNQARDEFKKRSDIEGVCTEVEKDTMARLYAKLNSAYYAGKAWEIRETAALSQGYRLWMEHAYGSILCQYLEYIVDSADQDYNYLRVED